MVVPTPMDAREVAPTPAMVDPAGTDPFDTLGRPIRDLRLSLTDRCNFRCSYCMPADRYGTAFVAVARPDILTTDELTRLAGIFARLGVQKLRITGGEPLVRRNVAEIVGALAAVEGIRDIALTTNGSLLADKAAELRAAGLRRVTVSLDSLDDDVFGAMNGVRFPVAKVLAGIDRARQVGLTPIKLNMLVKRGVNESSVLPMARYAREHGLILRLIEYMDVGNANGWRLADVVPAAELVARIHAEHPLERLPSNYRGEVATRWRYLDGAGELGAVASVSQPFCGSCSRARISAEGMLYKCLFATRGQDLRAMLRGGSTDAEIGASIERTWTVRDDRYSETRLSNASGSPKVEMHAMGG